MARPRGTEQRIHIRSLTDEAPAEPIDALAGASQLAWVGAEGRLAFILARDGVPRVCVYDVDPASEQARPSQLESWRGMKAGWKPKALSGR